MLSVFVCLMKWWVVEVVLGRNGMRMGVGSLCRMGNVKNDGVGDAQNW